MRRGDWRETDRERKRQRRKEIDKWPDRGRLATKRYRGRWADLERKRHRQRGETQA